MAASKQEITAQIIELLAQLSEAEETPTADPTEPTEQPIEMLTVKECTEVIKGVSEHMIRSLVTSGKIPHIRAGDSKYGKILISKSALLEYFIDKK